MRILARLLVLITFSHAQLSIAGAWGVGSFENDDALDYVEQTMEDDIFQAVGVPFSHVVLAQNEGFIDAPTGSQVLAAAEIYAAIRGKPGTDFPGDIALWVESKSWKIDDKVFSFAEYCSRQVLDPDRSELAQLWQEDPEFYDKWLATVNDLLKRLR